MTTKPKILWIGEPSTADGHAMAETFQDRCEVVLVSPPFRAVSLPPDVVGVVIEAQRINDEAWLGRLLQNEQILEGMPDGVALLDSKNTILWANDCLKNWLGRRNLAGANFYQAFESPEMLGPDFCPFHTALATGEASSSNLRCADNRYFQVHCVPFQSLDVECLPLTTTQDEEAAARDQAATNPPSSDPSRAAESGSLGASSDASESDTAHEPDTHASDTAHDGLTENGDSTDSGDNHVGGAASNQTLIVTIRDVSFETLQQQKMAAIHKAGVALADLTAEEVFQMEVEERIELLKSNILHYTKDLLNFDVVEIRLLGQETGELVPLLHEGIDETAAKRKLFAKPEGQGVTGFVAATGKSYLCEDTMEDPLYIEGCVGAKSSLTVPLIQHDEVIGTFNVESPEPHAFNEHDLQFLEIFSRDVANALNTLELLIAQQANTAQASVEAIHREVALPVDEILNDAVHVMEAYIGHDASVVERLQRILRNARDIKQLIHKVGQEMAPAEAVPAFAQIETRPTLRKRRVLVVDDDESVRSAAHSLLDRFECTVETAHDGDEACYMLRNAGTDAGYDVVISSIKLPDMSGFDLLMKLRESGESVPLILMTGFGYDPGHTIVKARQAGLPASAILYKPFRLDQLLETVEGVIQASGEVRQA